jgi:predicted phosphodiesterase
MKDYETNFYLPFKGFEKPIYAIPGNHDWFDANEGFNANFLSREEAITSLRARLEEDTKNVIKTDERFAEITAEAERLRSYYRIRNGLQRAPFFEMHTAGFSLICADTGILRRLDEKQKAWFEAALQRAGNNFKMVVLGHPFFVAGKYQAASDADFNALHEILKRYDVKVAMAGDTHDFEFYRVPDAEQEMFHFVNGGGGAYLSIGTAVGFPSNPDVVDYAFYPRTDEITAKISNEAPVWKYPFYWWLRWLRGYPFDSEMVSGAFDFNRAPFFQSFLEVSVERSQNRVRFLLYGVNGQLRWRDIQTGGQIKPPDKSDDDPVEFIAPLIN